MSITLYLTLILDVLFLCLDSVCLLVNVIRLLFDMETRSWQIKSGMEEIEKPDSDSLVKNQLVFRGELSTDHHGTI